MNYVMKTNIWLHNIIIYNFLFKPYPANVEYRVST
jgi:hypothetical protein